MALKWHPDRNANKADAERMMKKVNEIWGVLSKEKTRYDNYLRGKMEDKPQYKDPFTWGTHSANTGTWGADFNEKSMEDILNSFHFNHSFNGTMKRARKIQKIKDRLAGMSENELDLLDQFITNYTGR